MYNSLLQRQIRKYLGASATIPDEFKPLLDAVNQSYDHYEADRDLIERSMDLSSLELLEANMRLRSESDRQTILLRKLQESLDALQFNETPHGGTNGVEHGDPDDELIAAADLIRQEIERRKEAETKLQESEARFRLLAENSTDVVARYSIDGVCRYISPSCFPLFGYRPEDLVGRYIHDHLHADDVEDVQRMFTELLSEPAVLTVSARHRRKDGSYRWFETTAHAVRDAATGEAMEIHTASRDITERKEVEQELQKLSLVASKTDNGVAITDADGFIEWINDSFTRITGYSTDEVKGVRQEDLLRGPLTDPATIESFHAARQARVACTEEMLNYRRDGSIVWLSMNVAPILDADGRVVRFVGIMSDISERKQTEANIRELNEELQNANALLTEERDMEKEHVRVLEQLNLMKSEFVSSVSHELRTPLASIIGFAQTILVDPELPSEMQQEFLQIILEEGKRLAKLINDMLDLARIESGRAIMEKSKVDLEGLIRRALYSIAMQADDKSLTVNVDIPVPGIIANVDPDRMSQVVINLLSNAVKFTPNGGSVTVYAGFVGNDVKVEVSDTGLGIPREDMNRLFDKFYRVHRPGLDIRGTGLGLAIVKQLVELHGGRITVRSEVGEGSTFTILIPQS